MTDDERKLQRLREDFSGEDDLESLLEVGRFLNQWDAPKVDAAKLAQVLAAVSQEETHKARARRALPLRALLMVLLAQIRIVRGAIWLASALVMALGAVVTVGTYSPTTGTLALVLIAPLVAALGIAFIYGEDIDPPTELLMSTPISPRIVLLARMALVFGFNLALGLAASLAVALTTPQVSFMPLVQAWLAPMAFLSALAFLMSVLFNDPLVGVLVSLGMWAALCVGHLTAVYSVRSIMPDLLSDGGTRGLFWLLALTMGGLALWLAGREERLKVVG